MVATLPDTPRLAQCLTQILNLLQRLEDHHNQLASVIFAERAALTELNLGAIREQSRRKLQLVLAIQQLEQERGAILAEFAPESPTPSLTLRQLVAIVPPPHADLALELSRRGERLRLAVIGIKRNHQANGLLVARSRRWCQALLGPSDPAVGWEGGIYTARGECPPVRPRRVPVMTQGWG